VLRFEPAEEIVQQGDPADAVYIIAEGEAEVWLTALDGHAVRLGTLGRHSLLGEIAVLCNGRRTATVRAKDPVVTLKLSAQVFLDLVRQNPDISMKVMTILAERLEKTTEILRQSDHE
jgi:CRP/FNR family transcriptional regulator, cyclic AMP receptor protein